MRYFLLALFLCASIAFAQEASGPAEIPVVVAPGLPDYSHVTTVELTGDGPVDIKQFLPESYSEAAAEFSSPVTVNDTKQITQTIFLRNDVPIIVEGATTMTLHWNE